MTVDNYIKAEIVSFAAQEASDAGGYDQMLAVACILANRRKAGWHGGDWIQILEHAGEVSALEPMPRTIPNLADPSIRRLLVEVDDIYLGMFNDQYTGYLGKDGQGPGLYYVDAMYNDHGGAMRPWFQEKILNNPADHARVAQVGTLYIFS